MDPAMYAALVSGPDKSPQPGFVEPEEMEKVLRLTREMFPGEVTWRVNFDPSEPDDPWVAFDVAAEGDFAAIRSLRFQWHDAVERICPNSPTTYRIAINPL